MYKCTSCNYELSDSAISYGESLVKSYTISNGLCPKCKSKVTYINELEPKIKKYRISMNLDKK